MASKIITFLEESSGYTVEDKPTGGSLPSGIIVMWSGLLANIPTGWALCDGAGGRPDLRDKFIMGWANGVDPGDTGGSSILTHLGAAVADHSAQSHSGAAVDNHTNVAVPQTATAAVKIGTAAASAAAQTHTHTIASITHTVTQPSQHPALTHQVTQPNDHANVAPPYYKLAYIMKV
jgi:microcystin-dependent protein